MAKAKENVNVYKREDADGETVTLGAYVGTPLDDVLAVDSDWEPDRSPARDVAPKTEKVGKGADYSKLPVEELRQIAAQRGVDDVETLTKPQAIKAIAEAEKAAAEQPSA